MRENTILICGAGPVGLTAAHQISRHGVGVRIVDVSDGPTTLSKALVVWRRTLRVLDSALPYTEFLGHGHALKKAIFSAEGKPLGTIDIEDDSQNLPIGLLIPQSETERVLIAANAARGVEVQWQTRLIDFTTTAEGIACTLETPQGEEQFTCSRLIGCDGAHSVVRHRLKLDFPGEAVERRWLLADIDVNAETDPHEIRIEASRGGSVALFPVGKRRWRIIADGGPTVADTKRVEPTVEELQNVLDARTGTGWKIVASHWRSEFQVSERQIKNYVHGRVTLAGDAAHVHSPAGGQGMNTGIQDAANLAWKIALVEKGGAPENLIDTYQQERHPVGEDVVKNTGRMLRTMMISNPIARHLRDLVMRIGLAVPAVRRHLTEFLSEENITARGSRLCGPGIRGAAIQPGDAFPHLAIEHEGQKILATDRLRGNHATCIVWGEAAAESLPTHFGVGGTGFPLTTCGLDPDASSGGAELQKQFGLTDRGCVLVRPDGVVAAVGKTTAVVAETFKLWHAPLNPTARTRG